MTLKPRKGVWRDPVGCQCGGRWIVPKRNGAFRIGGSKSPSGKDPIRANWPTIWKHVPLRGFGQRPYSPRQRLREFAICPSCGERNLKHQEEWRRKYGYPRLPPEPQEPLEQQKNRTRDFSEDAGNRKAKARLHKARQARR